MRIEGDYVRDGYALVRGLVPPDVCAAVLHRLKTDIERAGRRLEEMESESALLRQPTNELYGYHYPPLLMLLWGLTPAMEMLSERTLLPTYDFFRIYRKGDICRVHADRPSCEHSVSLTLAYSDDRPWSLEVGEEPVAPFTTQIENGFGDTPFSSLEMMPGDAVVYNGITRRHGRVTPNANRWSAHLFCHWVDADGPHAGHAFDGRREQFRPVSFAFG